MNNSEYLKNVKQYMSEGDNVSAERLIAKLLEKKEIPREVWQVSIQIALRSKNLDVADHRVKSAIKLFPFDPVIKLLEVRVHCAMLQYPAALNKVDFALKSHPDSVELKCEKLNVLKMLGFKLQAISLIRKLFHEELNLRLFVYIAISRFCIYNHRFNFAKLVLNLSLEKYPNNHQAVKLLQDLPMLSAQYSFRLGRIDHSENILEGLVENTTSEIALKLWVETALKKRNYDVALKRSSFILKIKPDSLDIQLLRARSLFLNGMYIRSLKAIEQVSLNNQCRLSVLLLKLEIYKAQGEIRLALVIVNKLRAEFGSNEVVMLKVAKFYYSYDRMYATKIILVGILLHNPNNHSARMLYYQVCTSIGFVGIYQTFRDLLNEVESREPISSQKLIELLVVLTLIPNIEIKTNIEFYNDGLKAISLLSSNLLELSEGYRIKLLRQAERFNDLDNAKIIFYALLDKGPRTPSGAVLVYKRILEHNPNINSELLLNRLLIFIPANKLTETAIKIFCLLNDFNVKIHKNKIVKKSNRTISEVRDILYYLEQNDTSGLALRYLRFCRLRWPEDIDLQLTHARLMLAIGYPYEALDLLVKNSSVSKNPSALKLRIQCLLDLNLLDQAYSEIDKIKSINSYDLFICKANILIMMGYLNEARELYEKASSYSYSDKTSIRHSSLSIVGSKLNDLSLFKLEELAFKDMGHTCKLAAKYNYPAMKIIARNSKKEIPSYTGHSLIPNKIVQYWDSPIIPDRVASVMRSWHILPDFEYSRFNYHDAKDFLRINYGSDYEKAFRLAKNAAEGADLFRLCYLRRYGGIYVDADDYRFGHLNDVILPNTGLICFREDLGTLANNFLAAVPEHPAIVQASVLAVESLLAGDNEITWSKTGPGLFTRVVADYLINKNSNLTKDQVTILPIYILKRNVRIHTPLPYKQTSKDWRKNKLEFFKSKSFYSNLLSVDNNLACLDFSSALR